MSKNIDSFVNELIFLLDSDEKKNGLLNIGEQKVFKNLVKGRKEPVFLAATGVDDLTAVKWLVNDIVSVIGSGYPNCSIKIDILFTNSLLEVARSYLGEFREDKEILFADILEAADKITYKDYTEEEVKDLVIKTLMWKKFQTDEYEESLKNLNIDSYAKAMSEITDDEKRLAVYIKSFKNNIKYIK